MPLSATVRCALLGACCLGALLALDLGSGPSRATPVSARSQPPLVLQNVRLFDGRHANLPRGNVLIVGETIVRVSHAPILPPPGSQVLDGGGRVLMPGLIDAHWHVIPPSLAHTTRPGLDPGYLYAHAVAEAKRTLLRGFTSVRDVGGLTFGLKAAIDAGIIPGPRIFPSGTRLSRHGSSVSQAPYVGFTLVPDALSLARAARTQFENGASYLMLGISDPHDPRNWEDPAFSVEELRTAVKVAHGAGSYVAAHALGPGGIRRALESGVRSVEYGHLADEASVRLMAETGAWLSVPPVHPEELGPLPTPIARSLEGAWERVLRWAKTAGVKVAFGSDGRASSDGSALQNLMLMRYGAVFSPSEILAIATSGNAELLALSGARHPYPDAALGVLAPGAWADLLLVDGDPTRDSSVIGDPERNFLVIIKGGRIYKNLLHPPGAAETTPRKPRQWKAAR